MAHLNPTSEHSGWLAHLAFAVLRRRPRSATLDVRTLSDHLKRDLGFLDGSDPDGRHS